MSHLTSRPNDPTSSTRRTVLVAGAWTVPAIQIASVAPAFAASEPLPACPTPALGFFYTVYVSFSELSWQNEWTPETVGRFEFKLGNETDTAPALAFTSSGEGVTFTHVAQAFHLDLPFVVQWDAPTAAFPWVVTGPTATPTSGPAGEGPNRYTFTPSDPLGAVTVAHVGEYTEVPNDPDAAGFALPATGRLGATITGPFVVGDTVAGPFAVYVACQSTVNIDFAASHCTDLSGAPAHFGIGRSVTPVFEAAAARSAPVPAQQASAVTPIVAA